MAGKADFERALANSVRAMLYVTLIMLGPQYRILIVEDDPDLQRILVHTLSAVGYRVVPAYGGEDALRKIRRHPVALVLTDLSMPGMSGVELINQIKRDPETRHIPIIAVTAYWMERMGDSATEVGCDDYLMKPFRSADLLAIVQQHLPSHLSSR